ncbi:hypothetical protein S2091_4710 [Solimicrobium silvestre]|uniref:Uncharacterized protein n=1 Tax=Solimicrobium silvestre TaxID=2099400 RepID=A0A2S9GS91_9BURK|nr:hypothetical protein S2091_4710 [Solimicrobium silvestre]
MTRAILKVIAAGEHARIVCDKLPGSKIENGTVIMSSALGSDESLNAHLVWLWGMVKNERRVLKSAVEAGARIVCECSASKGEIRLLPNGAEMLHLLGAELVISSK